MGHNPENYYWAIKSAYELLNNETPEGALAHLPAGGVECERLVEKAVAILKEQLKYYPD
jgi:hypothetical protein